MRLVPLQICTALKQRHGFTVPIRVWFPYKFAPLSNRGRDYSFVNVFGSPTNLHRSQTSLVICDSFSGLVPLQICTALKPLLARWFKGFSLVPLQICTALKLHGFACHTPVVWFPYKFAPLSNDFWCAQFLEVVWFPYKFAPLSNYTRFNI